MAAAAESTPTLFAWDGRPVRRSQLGRETGAPSRYGVRQPYSDRRVAPWLNPSRLMRILADAALGETEEFLALAEEVEERDLHYAAVLGTRKRAAALIRPVIEAASPSARDAEIAEAARALTRRRGWHGMCHDALDALGKGYSASEIVWDTRARPWAPRRVEWRDPAWFRLDPDDGKTLRLIAGEDLAEGRPLEPYRWIVHQPKLKSGLPIRGGLARLGASALMLKSFAWTDWMRLGELLGVPFRLGRYGPGATEDDIATLLSALANLQSDGAGAIPDSMNVELVALPASGGADGFHERQVNAINAEVSKGVLGQTMTSDDGSSRSQAEVHDRVRQDICEDDAIQLAETLQRDLIEPFTALNFGAVDPPRLSLPAPDPQRRQAVLDALKHLVPLGARVSEAWARAQVGIPDPEEGEALLAASPGDGYDAEPDMAAQGTRSRSRAARPSQANPEPLLDQIEAQTLDADWRALMDPLAAPLQELARRSRSRDEFIAGLADALGEMDDSPLRAALAAAMFAARGAGDAGG